MVIATGEHVRWSARQAHDSQAEQTSSVREALVHMVEQVSEVHNIPDGNDAKDLQKSPVSPHRECGPGRPHQHTMASCTMRCAASAS